MKLFETARLTIEEANLQDASFFYELLNSPGWLSFIGSRNVNNTDDARQYIENTLLKAYRNYGFGFYKLMLKNTHAPVGICGFIKREFLPAPDIGFALLPEFEGEGLMFEAAGKMVNYGFDALNFGNILAITKLNNLRSQSLLMRLGFERQTIIHPETLQEDMFLFAKEKCIP